MWRERERWGRERKRPTLSANKDKERRIWPMKWRKKREKDGSRTRLTNGEKKRGSSVKLEGMHYEENIDVTDRYDRHEVFL